MIFLDMLGTEAPYGLLFHSGAETEDARALKGAVSGATANHWSASDARLMCDDEPVLGGADVPALTSATLLRLPQPGHGVAPHLPYHLGDDHPDEAAFVRIDESVDVLTRLLSVLGAASGR